MQIWLLYSHSYIPQAEPDTCLETANEPVAGTNQLVVRLDGWFLSVSAHAILYEDDRNRPHPQEQEPNQNERQRSWRKYYSWSDLDIFLYHLLRLHDWPQFLGTSRYFQCPPLHPTWTAAPQKTRRRCPACSICALCACIIINNQTHLLAWIFLLEKGSDDGDSSQPGTLHAAALHHRRLRALHWQVGAFHKGCVFRRLHGCNCTLLCARIISFTTKSTK